MTGPANHTPAQIVRQLIIDLSLGSASGTWPVYHSSHPDTPDDSICVYTTVGQGDGRVQQGETQEHDGIQVRVRGVSDAVAFARAKAIAEAFDNSVLRTSVTVESSTYLVQTMNRLDQILPLGRDSPSSNRRLYTFNALTHIRKTS